MLKKIIFNGRSRRYLLVLIDIAIFCVINAMYYVFPQLLGISATYSKEDFTLNSAILLLSVFASRFAFMLYTRVWRYTCTASYFKMVCAEVVGVCVALPITYIVDGDVAVWHYAFVAPLCLIATLFSRFAYRLIYKYRGSPTGEAYPQLPVAIVGAGQTGVLLAQELKHNPHSSYKPVMFIDTDSSKVGKEVSGLKIYREDDKLPDILEKNAVRDVLIAINYLDDEQATHLFEYYSSLQCKVKIYDVPVKDMDGAVGESKPTKGTLRDFKIEDLLFRKQINVKDADTVAYYSGKTLLVTGGGGSIGSEICRQLAACDIKKLIIVDIYENNAYDIQQELIREYGDRLDLTVEIASVRDRQRLDDIFNTYRPDIVFHAAAHKHVPLMEHSAAEAIKNNVIGTYNTADME
ncbi:MAG: polysaccharide biosynthesis protein [Clostridia bacterium]|nr:polysaccharide biosynthesis protein [Clostridia bacterium]